MWLGVFIHSMKKTPSYTRFLLQVHKISQYEHISIYHPTLGAIHESKHTSSNVYLKWKTFSENQYKSQLNTMIQKKASLRNMNSTKHLRLTWVLLDTASIVILALLLPMKIVVEHLEIMNNSTGISVSGNFIRHDQI